MITTAIITVNIAPYSYLVIVCFGVVQHFQMSFSH